VRILIHSINFRPEPTGIGKYTGEMAEWLAARGHAVRVITAPPHYPQWRVFPGYSAWQFSREKRVPVMASTGMLDVFRCPLWVPRVPRGWRRILHLASFALSTWPPMLRQIGWRPDVVLLIAPPLFCSPQALCVARLSGAVAWLHVQDFEVDTAFQLTDFSSRGLRRCVQAVERVLMRRFARVSAVSDRMVERLAAKGVDPTRGQLFPNWVDTSAIYPLPAPSRLREELGIGPETVVALYSGSMGKKQGLQLLLEASRRLASWPVIQLVICTDGPDREAFAQMVQQAGNLRLLRLQPADRLNELLNLSDIHLLPQLADAADLVMPSKLTGMMASGRAIVATAQAGTQLAAILEGRGIVTPPGEVNALVAAIVRLAGEPALRRQLGEEARKYAVCHMNRDQILEQFELSLMTARGHATREGHGGLPARPSVGVAVLEELAMSPPKAGED
jgi:colanic acid biosynthesis glycosyl transferase WcaI